MDEKTISVSATEIYPSGYIQIDNGLDEVQFAPRDLFKLLTRVCDNGSRTPHLVLDALLQFRQQVDDGMTHINEEGDIESQHIGSNNLKAAVVGLFYEQGDVDPKKWGLITKTEARLLAELVGETMQKVDYLGEK